jgi:hypothetical protein
MSKEGTTSRSSCMPSLATIEVTAMTIFSDKDCSATGGINSLVHLESKKDRS